MRVKITQDHEFYMDGFKLTQLKAGDILDVTESNADALRCEGVAIELKVQPPTVETKKRRGKP